MNAKQRQRNTLRGVPARTGDRCPVAWGGCLAVWPGAFFCSACGRLLVDKVEAARAVLVNARPAGLDRPTGVRTTGWVLNGAARNPEIPCAPGVAGSIPASAPVGVEMPTNDVPNDGGKMVTPARERIPDSIPGGTDEPATHAEIEPACSAAVPWGPYRGHVCVRPLKHAGPHRAHPPGRAPRRRETIEWGHVARPSEGGAR